jgi:replicative DNA helicase
MTERKAIYDSGAEAAILGAIMLDNHRIIDCEPLNVDHFFREAHRVIFSAMRALAAEGQPIDTVTLSSILRKRGKLKAAGGGAYLVQITTESPAALNIPYYVKIVREQAALRNIVGVCQETITNCYDLEGREPSVVADLCESQMQNALAPLRSDQFQHRGHKWLGEALDALHETYAKAADDPDSVRSTISSTFDNLDELLELPGDNLIVVGARPGMGKSSLAVNWMRNYSELGEVPYLFVLEDATREQLFRLLAQLTRVPASSVRKLIERRADHPDSARDIEIVLEMMKALPDGVQMGFDDTPNQSIQSIRMKAKQRVREGATMIFIDHALKIRRPGWIKETRDKVSYIVEQCAILAMELGVPVILFTQLKRLDRDRRPTYDDLKETGTFEESGRAIILLYREEYALAQKTGDNITYPHPIEFIVPKVNHWAVGTAYAMFEPTRTLIREPTQAEMSMIEESRADKIPFNDVVKRFSSGAPF